MVMVSAGTLLSTQILHNSLLQLRTKYRFYIICSKYYRY